MNPLLERVQGIVEAMERESIVREGSSCIQQDGKATGTYGAGERAKQEQRRGARRASGGVDPQGSITSVPRDELNLQLLFLIQTIYIARAQGPGAREVIQSAGPQSSDVDGTRR